MDTVPPRFLNYLKQALQYRDDLIAQSITEQTDCYRLFHGAVEQWPSLTIDRYGSVLLFQTWRTPLNDEVVEQMAAYIEEHLAEDFHIVWCDRRQRGQVKRYSIGDVPLQLTASELGIRYVVDPIHRGIDPLLF